jgi:bifunctional non-homologous end joining protein LigD
MPLDTYQRKRDFAKTPEPVGAVARPGGHRFVVQRHRATRLHYDFRLEIDGVLVSWAVPKGPTLDPAERRMAVHVEDHPLDYYQFEGVIPKGEYGGGDVIVWDWGTFIPEETEDPGNAVRDGELKFSLAGEKLRGRFTIVRTGGRRRAASDDKDQWLLIKKRDEFAVDGWNAEDHLQSVKTGRTNEEVLAGAAVLWNGRAPAAEAEIDLSAAREEPMPEFIEPMKATLADSPFNDDDWVFEVKWDGYRVEAVVRDGAVRLWTRRHNDAAGYFPDLTGAPDWINARRAIVDGEVVALDPDGNPSFSLLQDRTGIRGAPGGARRSGSRPDPADVAAIPLVYQVFDLLYLDGRSLLEVPLEQRKRLLRSVLREGALVRFASDVARDGEAFYEAARERGLEGMVAKLRTSRYEPGRRSKSWLKVKLRAEQELVVAGWLEGKGSHKDLGSLIVGVYDAGKLRHAGQVGSGIDAKMRRLLLDRLRPLAREESPLDPAPRIKGAHWVEPSIVVRAEFAEWTTDGLLRQAAFKGLELDRDPSTVTRERAIAARRAAASAERRAPAAPTRHPANAAPPAVPASSESVLAALDALPREGIWHVGGRELHVTNLDKVLWPDAGITKRDLLRYYVGMAPTLLPYLAGRAVNLHRYPDGIGHGHGFWQKDVPAHAPEWIARWTYVGSEGAKDYVIADQVATLGWLAQEAAIEIHPWTSPTGAPGTPSYALIDIDPGEKTTWDEVLTLARLYRTALEHLSVRGWPKVTGQRGIQVWIPIKPIYTFDQTRDWVERLSRAIGQTVPDLVSWEWSKSARKGLARLDYTQNAINRTLVAPYSVRPAPGAPISAPISWNELQDADLRPNRWTILTIAERLSAVGDLFAPVLASEQELPPL